MVKVTQAGLIFSEHEYGKGVLSKSTGGYEGKIKVNYTSVRTGDFLPLEPQFGSKRFVALGRLVPKKGFEVLVRAVAILMNNRSKRFVVDIYGSGPEEVSLNGIIQSNGLQGTVNLKGIYKNDDLPKILFDSLAIIVPSIMDKSGDMDGIPTVIYEAMALGRAVIASRISGIPEIVHNNINGYLVDSGDPVQLADRMSKVLEDPQMSFAMGNEGRRLVEKNHEYIHNASALIGAIDDFLHLQK
jgi:glycosyltransferase involved in cell wall biosynthesis